MTKYTEEQKEFLIKNNWQRTAQELVDLYNKEFDENIKVAQVLYFRQKYHLKCGVDCTFKKGITPHNKGKKWDDYMSKIGQKNSKKTQFKKGNKPHNWLPVGSEWTDSNEGYKWIKVAEPNDWQLKHRYIYEQHYGKIPKGYCVIFLDQDKTNFNLDNLELVRIKDKLTAKNKGLLSTDKEVTKTGIMTAKLINKTYEVKNG